MQRAYVYVFQVKKPILRKWLILSPPVPNSRISTFAQRIFYRFSRTPSLKLILWSLSRFWKFWFFIFLSSALFLWLSKKSRLRLFMDSIWIFLIFLICYCLYIDLIPSFWYSFCVKSNFKSYVTKIVQFEYKESEDMRL